MGLILKFLIVGVLAYFAYRKLDKQFAVTEEFDATVVEKFVTKSGKVVGGGDDNSSLDVKDEWKYFLVLKEDNMPLLDEVVGEVSPESAPTSRLKEEVSAEVYNKLSLEDHVTVVVSYSRWTKKLLKTEILPGWNEYKDEKDKTVVPE